MLNIDDFEGSWSLSREITDQLAGQNGKLIGTARFVRRGPGALHYEEAGKLELADGTVLEAERRYIWQFVEDRVDMTFDDGKAFHSFVPRGYVSGTEHPCGDDIYNVRYDFVVWPRWRTVWLVKGPRKDYTSITEFTR